MSDKKAAIRQIWYECFHDTTQWMDMFFSKVYDEEDALVLEYNGHAVSSMLLRQYKMLLYGEEISMGYISGAATRRMERGRGYMSELVRIALRQAHHRGNVLVSLIPASRRLFYFYERMGFSTVFYVKNDRYTSLHSFVPEGSYFRIEDYDTDMVYDFFSSCEFRRDGTVIHSRDEFNHIMDDNRIDGGEVVVVGRKGEEGIAAVGFAAVDEYYGRLVVKDILAKDDDAMEGLLAEYRRLYDDFPFTVVRPVGYAARPIDQYGMVRIVNVGDLFLTIAHRYPDLKLNVRVRDDLIHENDKVFMIESGSVSALSRFSGTPDLDVTVQTLALILFNKSEVGEIFGIPSVRPFMALMLE